MTEEELKLAYRFVLAVERIASAATAAVLEPITPATVGAMVGAPAALPDTPVVNGAPTPPALEAAKRARGRPRKDATEPALGGAAIGQLAAKMLDPAPAPVAEPTEDERKAKFAALKVSLQNALALHGEAETRQRLKYSKFSEVPFDAIDATIKALDA